MVCTVGLLDVLSHCAPLDFVTTNAPMIRNSEFVGRYQPFSPPAKAGPELSCFDSTH
jgi:hypothetical protein